MTRRNTAVGLKMIWLLQPTKIYQNGISISSCSALVKQEGAHIFYHKEFRFQSKSRTNKKRPRKKRGRQESELATEAEALAKHLPDGTTARAAAIKVTKIEATKHEPDLLYVFVSRRHYEL